MAAKVLIIEDDQSSRKLFRDVLDAHGYEIMETAYGIDGYELARTHEPDLILMDIRLPDISGLEVIKWLKDDQDLKGIPIIALTALAMRGDEEKFRAAGCDAYVSKPISIATFLETVTTMLKSHSNVIRPV